MIKGKTKSGFDFAIEDAALDDYELLESFEAIDEGKGQAITKATVQLLGKDQAAKLKDHVRNARTGRVSLKKMADELGEIMRAAGEAGKNS